jgi:hypothetical protein
MPNPRPRGRRQRLPGRAVASWPPQPARPAPRVPGTSGGAWQQAFSVLSGGTGRRSTTSPPTPGSPGSPRPAAPPPPTRITSPPPPSTSTRLGRDGLAGDIPPRVGRRNPVAPAMGSELGRGTGSHRVGGLGGRKVELGGRERDRPG